jgi:metal-sulfur cluster biosynthetic enzyme
MKVKTTSQENKLEKRIWQALRQVLDPELGIDIVSLGLIYRVSANLSANGQQKVDILMTLTTPGCPLADSFDGLVRQSLSTISTIDSDEDVTITLTFDPPWTQDMMTDEAKAELGMV